MILWLAIGALIAWLASFRLTVLYLQRLMVDSVVAMAGALLGGLMVIDFGQALTADIQATAWIGAALGAVLLLALVHLRGRRDDRLE